MLDRTSSNCYYEASDGNTEWKVIHIDYSGLIHKVDRCHSIKNHLLKM